MARFITQGLYSSNRRLQTKFFPNSKYLNLCINANGCYKMSTKCLKKAYLQAPTDWKEQTEGS